MSEILIGLHDGKKLIELMKTHSTLLSQKQISCVTQKILKKQIEVILDILLAGKLTKEE